MAYDKDVDGDDKYDVDPNGNEVYEGSSFAVKKRLQVYAKRANGDEYYPEEANGDEIVSSTGKYAVAKDGSSIYPKDRHGSEFYHKEQDANNKNLREIYAKDGDGNEFYAKLDSEYSALGEIYAKEFPDENEYYAKKANDEPIYVKNSVDEERYAVNGKGVEIYPNNFQRYAKHYGVDIYASSRSGYGQLPFYAVNDDGEQFYPTDEHENEQCLLDKTGEPFYAKRRDGREFYPLSHKNAVIVFAGNAGELRFIKDDDEVTAANITRDFGEYYKLTDVIRDPLRYADVRSSPSIWSWQLVVILIQSAILSFFVYSRIRSPGKREDGWNNTYW